MRKNRRSPAQRGFAKIFTSKRQLFAKGSAEVVTNIHKNRALAHITKARDGYTAPTPLHQPVNHLHSIENSADTFPQFSLTVKMKRVKT
jgi:hypothetical protein